MPFAEKNINSPEQESSLENKESLNLYELRDDYSEEIRAMADDNNGNEEGLDTLKQEEAKVMDDWENVSAEIIEDNEEAYREGWRSSVESYFGVADFDIENFKRPLFDMQSYSEAYHQEIAAGGDGQKTLEGYHVFINGETYEMATKCFEAMHSVEEKKPGAVKLLHEKFGITNFQRYPVEILLQQAEELDNNKENALLAFSASDHNGAFDAQYEIWKKIYDHQQGKFNFRIVECSDKESLATQMIDLQQESEKQISLMFLSAHGESQGVLLGSDDETLLKEDIPHIKNMFSKRAQIIANSCSAGDVDGWVRSLSKEAGINAVGPDRPASISDIDFIGKEIVPQYRDSDIYSGFYNGFLLSKKKARA